MYLSYYSLKEKPFSISTNPKFLWLGEKHKEAFSVLKYGVLDNKGFLLLTGDVGAGKTTLIHALTSGLAKDVIWAAVPDPGLELLDFCRYIAHEFKLTKTFKSKSDFLIVFKEFLLESYQNGKKVLLIIDEAQRLSNELLEEIRMLSNIELGSVKLLNIFFVGQIEFNGILVDERNRAVRQRITVSYHIKPLSEKETGMYIRHRLKVAGATRNIFSFVAVNRIYKYSKGCPRVINIICDLAMLTGYSRGIERIGVDIIDESIKNFEVETNPAEVDEANRDKGRLWENINAPVVLFTALLLICGGVLFYFNFNKFGIAENTGNGLLHDSTTADGTIHMESSEPTNGQSASHDQMKKTQHSETVADQQTDNGDVSEKVDSTPPAVKAKPTAKAENAETEAAPFTSGKTVIGFNHNSNEFPEDAYKKLDIIADFVKKDSRAFVFVTGYTDELGSHDYNVNLSIFRANIVKSYLVGKGVDKVRIKVSGLGSANPAASNSTPEGRKANRRVEIEIFNHYNG